MTGSKKTASSALSNAKIFFTTIFSFLLFALDGVDHAFFGHPSFFEVINPF
ncbi:hypothetical protein KR50_07520 [Jeotgalibacillus campisalis]|uniref:Uncharacterized protein n=1 Tax=Jeotgalibacillus campisalis TaxID=220754 RepID=A0A0C2W2L6_9BACL|nr:hypothetical protein KR50_07520 [Jeotgalibacillus campisalis]